MSHLIIKGKDGLPPFIMSKLKPIELPQSIIGKKLFPRISPYQGIIDRSKGEINRWYNSSEYKDRLERAGVKDDANSLIERVNRTPVRIISSKSEEFIQDPDNTNGYFSWDDRNNPTRRGKVTVNKEAFEGNRGKKKARTHKFIYDTIIHELSHASDKILSDDALKWNESLTEGKLNPEDSSYMNYLKKQTEIRARGMEVITGARREGITPEEYMQKYPYNSSVMQLNKVFIDKNSRDHYIKNFVRNDNVSQQHDYNLYAKQGAKLIPKAQFGTGLIKRGIRWMNRHTAPTREHAMFEAQNNQGKELAQKKKRGLQDLQQDLKDLGYYTKIADNKWGPGTRDAIAKAEADGYKIDINNFTISGKKQLKRKSNSSFMSSVKQFFGIEEKVPTQEEFIQQKIKEVQEKAAKINEETATPYFPLGNYMPKHDFDFYGTGSEGKGKAKGMTPEQVRILFTKYKEEAQNYLDKHPNISNEAKKKVQRNINYYEKVIKDPQTVARKGTGIGFGCIYSASGSFDQENLSSAKRGKVVFANNRQLAQSIKNSSDSPYEILPFDEDSLRVGDIIQVGTSDSKIGPHHAVMVTGFDWKGSPKVTYTNAGTAGIDDRVIGSVSGYKKILSMRNDDGDPNTPGIQPQGLQIVRFKGDSGDIKQWEREYNSMYKGDGK